MNSLASYLVEQTESKTEFSVRNQRSRLKIIPYVGCKSGFAHIFDALISKDTSENIYDLFGGGGGFTIYACNRFGSERVTYNDNNPVLVNFMTQLQKSPHRLFCEYEKHRKNSSPEYYLKVRGMNIKKGVTAAGRFFYLSKNAFSGKIRFNSQNIFNTPMRKNTPCPKIKRDDIINISQVLKHLTIKNESYENFINLKQKFIYLDPPYINNTNGHYNNILEKSEFIKFVKKIKKTNKVMISEQNLPQELDLVDFNIYNISLYRSLQYVTQNNSKEIIGINY